jgi:Cysteine-rich CPCC
MRQREAIDAVVTDFDPVVGLGTVETDQGDRLAFHATALTDGTRTIGVGALVSVTQRIAPGGVYEASEVTLREASFPCPVCRRAVPGMPRSYEICPSCDWEDDPVQFDDPASSGGANGSSLDEARARWLLRD